MIYDMKHDNTQNRNIFLNPVLIVSLPICLSLDAWCYFDIFIIFSGFSCSFLVLFAQFQLIHNHQHRHHNPWKFTEM